MLYFTILNTEFLHEPFYLFLIFNKLIVCHYFLFVCFVLKEIVVSIHLVLSLVLFLLIQKTRQQVTKSWSCVNTLDNYFLSVRIAYTLIDRIFFYSTSKSAEEW